MAANPFYVDPLGGYGPNVVQGLSGLGQVLGDRQRLKQEQEKRKMLTQEATRLVREGTPDQVYQFSLENPELGQMIDKRMGYINKDSRENAFQTAMRIAQGENPIEAYGQRLQYLESIGANPAETQRELETAMAQYAENPEAYRALVANSVPLMFREEFGQYQKAAAQPAGEKFTGSYGNLALAMFGTNDSSRMTTQMLQQLDEEARRRQLERPPSTTVNINPEQKQFSNEQDLRKEVKADPTIKNFKDVQFAYDQVSTALKKPSAANDLTAATKFMKILDPGSVVRESELGLAMEATGKLDLAMNYFNRLQTGEKLTPSQRQDFLQAATALYEAASSRAKPVIEQYTQIARDSGLNSDRVIDKDLQSILRNPAMAKLPPALQNFSESDFAEAAAQAGVSVDEFINIMSR